MQRRFQPSARRQGVPPWWHTRRKFLLQTVFGVLLLLAYETGFAILLGKGIVYATGRSYVATTGMVTGAYVQHTTGSGGRGSQYFVHMTYEYVVDGSTQSGSSVGRFARGNRDRETAYSLVKTYDAGSPVPVRYDPDRPNVSYADLDDVNHAFFVWVSYLFVALLPILSIAVLWWRGDIAWPSWPDR